MGFLSLLFWSLEASRTIDPGTAWTIIVTLSGVIGAMGLFIAKRETSRSREIGKIKDAAAAEVLKAKGDAAKEVKEMLIEQIRELRGHKELTDTLLDVIDRKRKGG